MAIKKPSKTTEEQATEQATEQVLSPMQQRIKDVFDSDKVVEGLSELKQTEGLDTRLVVMLTTYLALSNALGADAPATQHAQTGLLAWEPAKTKEKATKVVKELKFDDGKEARAVLSGEPDNVIAGLQALLNHERVTDALKILITTYVTLVGIEGIDEAVIANARSQIESFGKKRPGVRPGGTTFHISDEKNTYTNFATALRANGHTDDTIEVNGKQIRKIDIAWRACRKTLLDIGTVEYDGVTYYKVPMLPEAIQGVRPGRKPTTEESTTEESTTEA